MKSIEYIKNNGQYVLTNNGQPIKNGVSIVAIAYGVSQDTGECVIYKHGDENYIKEWANLASKELNAAGTIGVEMAEELRIVHGQFDLNTLNDAIQGDSQALNELIAKHTSSESLGV